VGGEIAKPIGLIRKERIQKGEREVGRAKKGKKGQNAAGKKPSILSQQKKK